ncbi:MAG: hypothetical protein JJU46_02955 [Balneolaceae bacterium]|nr:hypothetical protein [Balneolaceae bacterium]MCH8550115.1 hypothetical protein [Balneolaceae bacterium]
MEANTRLYRYLSKEPVKKKIEVWTVYLAFAFFIGHLVLILLRNTFPDILLLQPLSQNYLSALYTPFSIILVYEVYLLILALPLSFTNSMRKQYEIISLIIIRNVFKDVSMFDDFDQLAEQKEVIFQIATDLGSGLLLFFLVGVFYQISLKRKSLNYLSEDQVQRFVAIKERVAIILLLIFVALTVSSIYSFGVETYRLVVFEEPFELDLGVIFFVEFYTVMIFSDVLIFIVSFMFSQTYARLLRNAGFVCSTVILRISLSAEPELSGWVAAAALLTGILSQLIYVYFSRLEEKSDGENSVED